METLVPEQGSSVKTSQASGDSCSTLSVSETVNRGQGDNVRNSASQVRSGTRVVLAAPAQMKHVVTSSASSQNTTQAVAVPQAGGGVSIVHLAIPSQPMHVQSVIQSNQQSVIQAHGGATLQSVQLPKNMILLNKLAQGSVIHSTDGDATVQPVQLITASKDEDGAVTLVAADDPKKRREILARRPSYRKILSDLSATDAQTVLTSATVLKEDSTNLAEASSDAESSSGTITLAGTSYSTSSILKAIQLATASPDSNIQGLQTLTLSNANSEATGTIVQYAQNQEGQFFVPVTVSAADLQTYQLQSDTSTPTSVSQAIVSNIQSLQSPQQLAEDATRKRENRLLKNREAAKECRRKKKEYIKCLENRVAVLENQNKALIEELKSLKKLYCQENE